MPSTSTSKSVKSIDKDGNEKIYASVAEAADDMLTFEKYKTYTNIRQNISTCCTGTGKANTCCDRRWEHVSADDDFVFTDTEWKQFGDTYLYFSKKYDFAYNKNKKRKVYGDKRNHLQMYKLPQIHFIDALWITFNGPINATQRVCYKDHESNFYENIHIMDNLCGQCGKLFVPSDTRKLKNGKSAYCSKECYKTKAVEDRKRKEQTDLSAFVSPKISDWKKPPCNLKTEDVVDKCKSMKCHYCNIDMVLRCEGRPQPDSLTIDAQEPSLGHHLNNIVPSCWFCNRMLKDYPLSDRQQLLKFLKGDVKVWDLSGVKYTKKDDRLEDGYTRLPYYTLYHEDRGRYPTMDHHCREAFLSLYHQQNKLDALYNVFPIIVFTANHILNASCDKVVAGNTDTYQVVPVFMNMAKNDLSNEEFKTQMNLRNYLTWNLADAKFILPDSYHKDSYFINKLFKTQNRFGVKSVTDWTPERRERLSASKIAKKYIGSNNKNSKPLRSIDKNGVVKIYANGRCAVEELKLTNKKAFTNISSCANGKLKTAYGYVWQFVQEPEDLESIIGAEGKKPLKE